jgi:hypothetical protein
MKRKNPYFVSENLQKEFQATRKKIASDERKREKLLKQIAENPTVKLQKQLAALDGIIAENTRKLPSPAFLNLLEHFDNYGLQMLEMIEKHDDRLLLTKGVNAPQLELINYIQMHRNTIQDSEKENSFEMITGLDAVIDKLRKIVEEKRRRAAERFPELVRKHRPPDYEMSEEYNKYVKFITEMIEKRERIAKDFKYATPEKRREVLPILAEMDKLIDESEQKLAEQYESHQKRMRYEDGMRELLKQGSRTELKELRAHLKKNPTSNGVMERILREEFPE